ncbi:hypothetical protein P154DRAFT_534572 [Amniculicola lignicola CBS 123094]|uniref:Uncharacterized protein n=1 Tax=Amniculicola lignicola CBS 123094 TaxID=1392246 RepID=A0A6A5WF37_9PLEO|nr:hypothetical protein P154DRAFT_534572 [Amniculicola lignicola CBS 123094]
MVSVFAFLILLLAFAPVITGARHYQQGGHYDTFHNEDENLRPFLPLLLDPEALPYVAIVTILFILVCSSSLRHFLLAVASALGDGIRDAGKPASNNAAITQLEKRIAAYKENQADLNSQLVGKDEEIRIQRSTAFDARKDAQRLYDIVDTQKATIKTLKAEVTSKSTMKLQDYISDLKSACMDKDHDLDKLTAKLDHQKSLTAEANRAKQTENISLRKYLDASKAKVDDLTLTIKDLENEARAHHAEKANLIQSRNKFNALRDTIHLMIEQTCHTLTREIAVMFLLTLSQNDFNICDFSVDPTKLENLANYLKNGSASGLRDPGNVKLEGYHMPLSRIVVGSMGISAGLPAPIGNKQLTQAQIFDIMQQQAMAEQQQRLQQEQQIEYDQQQQQLRQLQQYQTSMQSRPACEMTVFGQLNSMSPKAAGSVSAAAVAAPVRASSLALAAPLSAAPALPKPSPLAMAPPLSSTAAPAPAPLKLGKYTLEPASAPASAAGPSNPPAAGSVFSMFQDKKPAAGEEEFLEDEDGRPIRAGNGKKQRAGNGKEAVREEGTGDSELDGWSIQGAGSRRWR